MRETIIQALKEQNTYKKHMDFRFLFFSIKCVESFYNFLLPRNTVKSCWNNVSHKVNEVKQRQT